MSLKINVKSSFAVILLAVFMTGGITTNAAPKKGKEVGLQLYSLREVINKDVKGTIEKVGAMGYKLVEAAAYNDGTSCF